LPRMKQHPDWAEVFDMQLAWMEASDYFGEIEKEFEGQVGKNRTESVRNQASLPEVVTRALSADLTSAFARSIQNEMRQRLEGHLRYLRYLRGEPYWEAADSNNAQVPE